MTDLKCFIIRYQEKLVPFLSHIFLLSFVFNKVFRRIEILSRNAIGRHGFKVLSAYTQVDWGNHMFIYFTKEF